MGRDPTNVELFDIAQSNSEHSRHWFFKGELVIDGEKKPHNLMEIVTEPLNVSSYKKQCYGQGAGMGYAVAVVSVLLCCIWCTHRHGCAHVAAVASSELDNFVVRR